WSSSSPPYANLLIIWIPGIDLVRNDASDRHFLGSQRDEVIAFVEHHRLGGHRVLGHAERILGRDEISEDAVNVLYRLAQRVFEGRAMFEIVGSVDRQQFRIAVRHEAMAAAFEF